jgi:hypothetical protein
MNSQKPRTPEEKWEIAAQVVDKLQYSLDDEKISTEMLILKLSEYFPSDFPVQDAWLSVIYKTYVTPIQYKVLIENGTSKNTLLEKSSLRCGMDTIKDVINGNEAILETGTDTCKLKGFENCGSLIIVPMRTDLQRKEKVIGAFVVQSKSEKQFTTDDRRILDMLSDRLAIFIRYIDKSRRAEIIQNFFSELISNIKNFQQEIEIFHTVITQLSNKASTERWFSKEEINIVLFHPFYKDKLYLVCKNGEVNKDFRSKGEIGSNEILELLGSNVEALLKDNRLTLWNTEKEVKDSKLPESYQSYIISPMLIRAGNNIGFFILRNKHQSYAYEDEKELLSRFSDFTALTLRNFRRDKGNEKLQEFRKKLIRDHKNHSDEELYPACIETIESIYGKVGFAVVSLSQESRNPAITFSNIDGLSLDEPKFKEEIESRIISNNTDPSSSINNKLFIFSITAESDRITDFFIIKTNRHLGKSTTAFIEELLSLIRFKQSLRRKNERIKKLTEFSKEITENSYLTQENIFELVYKYTSQVMSVANMYIALLDKQTNEITFPLFYRKDDNSKKINTINIASRFFDKNSNKKARTEVILASKEPILIRTRKASKEWYAQPGHDEKINDPFASWAGVPIINNGEAIGVIAIYHPTVDYLYTTSNIVFLENIATHISDLLSRLSLEKANIELKEAIANNTELKEANQRLKEKTIELEKAQAEIIEKEGFLASSLIAQDITHRLNNALGSLSININQSREDIDQAFTTRDIEHLKDTRDTLLASSSRCT